MSDNQKDHEQNLLTTSGAARQANVVDWINKSPSPRDREIADLEANKQRIHKWLLSLPSAPDIQSTDPGRCRLLDLPGELRNQIYAYLLSDTLLNTPRTRTLRRPRRARTPGHQTYPTRPDVALLSTSARIHAELAPLAYARTTHDVFPWSSFRAFLLGAYSGPKYAHIDHFSLAVTPAELARYAGLRRVVPPGFAFKSVTFTTGVPEPVEGTAARWAEATMKTVRPWVLALRDIVALPGRRSRWELYCRMWDEGETGRRWQQLCFTMLAEGWHGGLEDVPSRGTRWRIFEEERLNSSAMRGVGRRSERTVGEQDFLQVLLH